MFWPYALGFAVVTLPAVLYYLSVSPFHPIVHDIILYPSRYYHRGRNLPFPRLSLHKFESIQVHLPIAAVAISFYVVATQSLGARPNDAALLCSCPEKRLKGFLVTFGLLAFVMYFKGFVRMEIGQMYLCIIPSLLLVAVLFQYRSRLSRPVQISVMGLVGLSVLALASSTYHQVKGLYLYHISVLEELMPSRGPSSQEIEMWCKLANPLTKGLCFLPEMDQIQTIEFIDNHTSPGQPLYVGLVKHDRIFANNNLIYFATQRLPATHWSHFDPGLQNSYAIQTEIIHDLELSDPPYVILDSEFEPAHEPNDSSKSTGVTLLDEYIRNKYQGAQTFQRLSIWQRMN
jgi:hypothetical protein